MIRRQFLALVSGMPATVLAQRPESEPCRIWPAWDQFQSHLVSEGGRVVDRSQGGQSTSEGQSYALFFALVANDRTAFDRILHWTEANLAGGDLTARLPAWQWGRRDDGSWGVIDSNAAADSDLWIAYTLAEASRLWKTPRYGALSELLAERILREETAELPGLGRTLLPASHGFQPASNLWRLNPSYVPLQLIRRLATLYPASSWRHLIPTSIEMIVRSSPRGFAPEWVAYKANGGFLADSVTHGSGSFNAIRVYLWAGMLAQDDPMHPLLVNTFTPMAQHIVDQGAPPLEVNSRTGAASGSGSAGFSAALLPLLAAARRPGAVRQQRLRLDAKPPLGQTDNYYDQVLTLFGLGWNEGHYRFAPNGALIPHWTCTSSPSSSQ